MRDSFWILYAVWLAAMIAMAIARLRRSKWMMHWVSLVVFVHCVTSIAAAQPAWGWGETLRISLVVLGLAWLLEAVGSHSGYPFGHYNYTTYFKPRLLGVPVIIPFAWLMMFIPSWAIAQGISENVFVQALITGAAMVAWDFLLDPIMVSGLDAWRWRKKGFYFGIPLSNFVGWFLGCVALTLIVSPGRVPIFPASLIYVTTGLMTSICLPWIFWPHWRPAVVGAAAMGAVSALLLWL